MQFVDPIRDKSKIELVKKILKERCFRNYILFILGINSGLRISDILNLKVKDVLNKNYIELKEQKTKKYKRFPISPYIKSELNIFIKGRNPNDWLFISRRGQQAITRVQAYRIIHNACIKAGVGHKIGTHTLRKTFGYHFYKMNKDIALLQNILNHSSPSITLRYIGINQDIIDSELKSFIL